MAQESLLLELSCQGGQGCIFDEEDITVVATVKNTGSDPVGFPLAYLRRRGPAVTLVDTETGRELPLRINLAPSSLLKEFTVINPGESVNFETAVRRDEIISFKDRFVDLTVKMSPAVDVQIGNSPTLARFSPTAKIKIIGADKIKRDRDLKNYTTPF